MVAGARGADTASAAIAYAQCCSTIYATPRGPFVPRLREPPRRGPLSCLWLGSIRISFGVAAVRGAPTLASGADRRRRDGAAGPADDAPHRSLDGLQGRGDSRQSSSDESERSRSRHELRQAVARAGSAAGTGERAADAVTRQVTRSAEAFHSSPRADHSSRSATSGSIRDARRAGK